MYLLIHPHLFENFEFIMHWNHSLVYVFLDFLNCWLLITEGVKRCLTCTCLMDKSDVSLHVFIPSKICLSLEARGYSWTYCSGGINMYGTMYTSKIFYHSMQIFLPFPWLRAHHETCKYLPTNDGLLLRNVIELCLAANNILLM